MATVYEIVQGLTQAAANVYDGALTEDGEPLTAGLQREEGNPLLDKRVMDGFNVRFFGDKMILSYQSEVQLKEVYANGFEGEIDQRLTDIVSFLKKECKKITGTSVSLKQEGEVDVRVESTSRVRSWVTAIKTYIIENADSETVPQYSDEKRVEESWKTFLNQGGWKGKRPDNDTRKKGSEVEKK
jgi:hypothetical protein|tara:strand:+ start:2788 stop:3342 length:555 start_codon:yes stop_codon:yes gene_type:complete